MKAPAILLLAITSCLLLSAEAASVKVITLENEITRSMGDKIREVLEIFKEHMKTGNSKLGIPVLEPIDLEHQKINIQEELFSLEGSVDNVHVDGLSDYNVQFADFKIAKWNFTLDLLWNSIRGKVSYDLDGLIMNKIPVYGTGDLEFEVKGLRFATQAKLKMNSKEKKMSIVNFSNTIISLDSIKVGITGLFNDEELSELISVVISENGPDVISDFQEQVIAEVDKLALKYGNEALDQISLDDILAIVN